MSDTLTVIKKVIKQAGADFEGVDDNSVTFRDPMTGKRLTLYTSACTLVNVRLSLKNLRERVNDFPPLVPTARIR
jgi:hypothetical protein